jgi:predicted nucleic acid-binding protein
MAANSIFIDTNVLVFATIPVSPFHSTAIAALHRVSLANDEAWISRQVLREYLVMLTRPGVLPMPLAGALAVNQISALTSMYHVADETAQVTKELLTLITKGLASGKQVHDANIVATCLANGIPRLLTHNIADFKRYSSLITIDTI